jgi:hypothetical protein
MVELLKGRDEVGYGNLIPSPTIRFKHVFDTSGITGPDCDVDESPFKAGYSYLHPGGKGQLAHF